MISRMHILYTLIAAAAGAAPASPPPGVVNEHIEVHFAPRSPNQIMSFYEARGFPEHMIDILSRECFITVGIHNKSNDVIWHELANWQFSRNGEPLHRKHRNYWLSKWKAMNMPQASISTFRWTLVPETLDYLPDEREGGNIILPRVEGPISIRASFATGKDKGGEVIEIEYKQLYCAENEE